MAFCVLPEQCVPSIPVTGITEGDAEISAWGPLMKAGGCARKESLVFFQAPDLRSDFDTITMCT